MKKNFTCILAISLLLLGLAGCSSNGNAPTVSSNSTKTDLVIATPAEAITLDPQAGWDGNSLYVMRQMYNGLVKLDNNMKIVGDLAESWKFNSDNTSVTFTLRKGVKFSNGDDMKATDVVYSINRAMKSPKVSTFTAHIKSVVANDDNTVTITTGAPYGPLMSNLCHSANYVVDQKVATAEGDKFSAAPVGTGPFKFVSWTSGDKIVLARNDNYFGGKVLPTSLTFKLMPDNSARDIALQTSEVDFNLAVDSADAKRIAAGPDTKLVTILSPKIEYFSMNEKVKPFDNQLVRQAVNYAIDRNSLCTVATAGYGVVTDSVINKQITGYTDNVTHYAFDTQKAKQLLAQAGYPDGFKTDILVYGDLRNTEAQMIQANLAAIGITAGITVQNSTTMLDSINKGQDQTFIQSYNNTTGDADTSMYMLFDSTVPCSSGNRAFVSIPQVDTLLDKARTDTDPAARNNDYAQVQQILTEQAVWVPLYNVPSLMGLRSGLQGYTPHPLGNDVFDQLHY